MSKAAVAVASLSLLLFAVAPSSAQLDPVQSAGDEAVRRQNAILEARQALAQAQTALRQGDLGKAAQLYEEALTQAQKAGGGVRVEKEQTDAIAGLVSVNLDLAQMAQRRGDLEEADKRVSRVLKLDPTNSAALSFKRDNDKRMEAKRGTEASPEVKALVPKVMEERVEVTTLVRDAQLLQTLGRLDEAEAKLKEATKRDPENRAAFYYLKLLQESRYTQESRKREISAAESTVEIQSAWNAPIKRELLPVPNPWAHTNLIHTSKQRQVIVSKLNTVRLTEVVFDDLQLGDVVRFLSDEAKRLDPDKRGLNFIINSQIDAASAVPTVTVDPATGAAIPLPPAEAVDLNAVTVRLVPGLHDVRLADVLDAITKVATQPIKYSIEDYAIVFSQRRPEPVQLYTRTFRVDPNTFIQGLESVSGVSFGTLDTGQGGGGGQGGRGGGGRGGQGGQDEGQLDETFVIPRVNIAPSSSRRQGGGFGGGDGDGAGQAGAGINFVTRTNRTEGLNTLVREYFVTAGVNLAPPATIFFNDRNGILFVRAAMQDLDLVEAALQVLNVAPPQLTIEAKFAEVRQNDSKAIGFDWFLGNVNLSDGGAIVGQAGTAPSLNTGIVRADGSPDVFPGQFPASIPSGVGSILTPSTFIPGASSDQLLTAGLRNMFGGGSSVPSGTTPALATITGILTDPQFRVVVRALEQRTGVDLLSAPKVTTLSGRQTQIAVVDIVTIVSGVDLNQQAGQTTAAQAQQALTTAAAGVVGTTVEFITQPLPFGPVLDVVPYVSADGFTIQMTIIPSITEFLGYDDPGLFIPQAQSAAGNTLGTPITAQLPLPRLRSRQVATSAIVWDGQTVVLGGLIAEDVVKGRDKVPLLGDLPVFGRLFRSESRASVKRNLLIFVTPTIIDPSGNRVHNDADLPFAQNAIPAQVPFQPVAN
jgi:general secretion pathway protein D